MFTDPSVRGTVWISGPPSAYPTVELAPPPGQPRFMSPGLDGTYLGRCYELVRGESLFELKRAGLLALEIERDWPRRIGGSAPSNAEAFHVLRCGSAWFSLFATLTEAQISIVNTRLLLTDFSNEGESTRRGRLAHQANVLAELAALASKAAAISDYNADLLLRVDYRART
jgi:hypothetical protein